MKCSKAKELTFTGRNIDAAEAERIGIVSHVFTKITFENEAAKAAESIASSPEFTLKEAKNILNEKILLILSI